MLKCKEVVKILSHNENVSLFRQVEIKFHLFICHHCRKYAQHLIILKKHLKKYINLKTKSAEKTKIQNLENKVISKIKNS